MNTENEIRNFTNRAFVEMVRTELASAGRPDVTIQRSWIDEDTRGHRFLLHVPVGTDLSVPLKAMDGFFHTQTDEDRKSHAVEFAKALINLRSAEAMLVKYAKSVHKATNAAVAAARADGLDVLLDRVGFKPIYAYHLNYHSWKEAALHVLAEVTIQHTSFYLRPHTSTMWIEEAEDVPEQLADILDEQRERQERIEELDALGCDLIVDGITLDLLAAHDLDASQILERAWKEQCVNLTVQHQGRDVSFSLVTSGGYITASIQLADAFWNGEHLWLSGPEADKDHKHLVGKSLGTLVPHPVFSSRPILDVFYRHADHFVFDLSDKFMFDADTGRIWREERLAA